VPSTAQQIAVNYTASMLSSSSDDSSDEQQWKICDKPTGGAFAWEQECKVLNCSTQEGTANPPSKKSVCCRLIYLMHFYQHILLAISMTSCLILEFESVLESMHSGQGWQKPLSISKWFLV
jgi:hypothetical protein